MALSTAAIVERLQNVVGADRVVTDEAELVHMVATAAAHDSGPIAFRYPRGEGAGVEMPARGVPLEIGRGRVLREGSRVAVLSFGSRLAESLKAAEAIAGIAVAFDVVWWRGST